MPIHFTIDMAVPEDVRKVPRPPNTVVLSSKTGRYAVRQRLGCRYVPRENGKARRVPIDGPIVGHIENGAYVPLDDIAPLGDEGEVDVKDWANVALCDRLSKDILEDLRRHYSGDDALRIYIMAVLRCCYEGISDRLLRRQYEETYLTEMYPHVNLQRTAVSDFLRNLGRSCKRISDFMRGRVKTVGRDDTLVIDGTLQHDDSSVNSLSAVSRKTKLTKRQDILVMYAYNATRREPVCASVYPGNMQDARAVKSFIEDNGIDRGLIVADRGFLPSAVAEATEGRPEIRWLVPIRRGSDVIAEHDMYSLDGVLKGRRKIPCRKVRISEDRWLYSFRDPEEAVSEETEYLNTRPDGLDPDFDELRRGFGTITFMSNADLDPELVYSIYDDRWLIELMFRFRKQGQAMDDTRENSEYSVMGSDFVDFLANLMGSRMLAHMGDRGLLDNGTYGDAMGLLERLKMTRVGDGDWKVRRIALVDAEAVEKLGLVSKPTVPNGTITANGKRRGRPPGSKDKKPRKSRNASGTVESS